jgi:hypothetical protein
LKQETQVFQRQYTNETLFYGARKRIASIGKPKTLPFSVWDALAAASS